MLARLGSLCWFSTTSVSIPRVLYSSFETINGLAKYSIYPRELAVRYFFLRKKYPSTWFQIVTTQPREKCYFLPKQQCEKVKENKCTNIPRRECKTIYKDNCFDEPVEHCNPFTQQQCRDEPVKTEKWFPSRYEVHRNILFSRLIVLLT